MTDPQSADALPSGSSRSRILLVDDDRTLRTAIRLSLEDAGYTVFPAEDPASALALVMHGPPPIDLVVTDLMMPGMNGADLVRELRARSPELPAIIISGVPAARSRTQFVIPPHAVFLEKTTAPRMLLPTIRTLLGPPLRPHLAVESESRPELRA